MTNNSYFACILQIKVVYCILINNVTLRGNMEQKAMGAVSRVTGIPDSDIISNSLQDDVCRARLFYYLLCDEIGLRYDVTGAYVNKAASTARRGAKSAKTHIYNSGLDRRTFADVRRAFRGEPIIDNGKYENEIKSSTYINGFECEIIDVTSSLLGSAYLGLIDGEMVLYSYKRGDAVRGLIEISEGL